MAEQPLRLTIHLQPKASRDEIAGWNEAGALVVRVTAPPVGGAANKRLIALLAKHLRIGKSRLTLVSGARSRDKVVTITGLDRSALGPMGHV